MRDEDAPCGLGERRGGRPFEATFQAAAFEDWVPRFATANQALAGGGEAVSRDAIAAYRGFFARRSPGAANIAMLNAYLCPQAGREGTRLAEIAALLQAPFSPDEMHEVFLRLAPFEQGNRRCARALRMSRRLAAGDAPETDRIWLEWEQATEVRRATPRRQFTRTPAVSPYVIQTFGSA